MKKKLTICIVSFLVLFGVIAELEAVTTKEWAVALNLSGRQRMLSQKMAKEFFLTKLNVDAKKNANLSKKTMKMFERTLGQLINGDKDLFIPAAPNKEILAQLQKVKSLWVNYKKALEGGDASKVMELNLPVLKNMNKGVGMYEKASIKAGIKSSGTVINVAGRQRMLSQKMSKEICLIALNMEAEKNLKNLSGTKVLFNKSHFGLIKGNKAMNLVSTTDKKCLLQMKKVDGLWKKFKVLVEQVISTKKADVALLKNVYKQNPILLKQMNRAVKLYEVTVK